MSDVPDTLVAETRPPTIAVEPRMVVVSHGGDILAVSNCVLRIDDPGAAAAFYIPRGDVGMARLQLNGRRGDCALRGRLRYFDVTADGRTLHDGAFEIETPKEGYGRLAGHIAFDSATVESIETIRSGA